MTTLTADHPTTTTATAAPAPARAHPVRRRTVDPAVRESRFQAAAAAVYAVMGWLLAASATVLAATGQLEFAREAGITDPRQYLVPTILEIAVIFVLLGGYLRACDGDSPALMWLLAVAITGFATWTNLTHGGPRAGRIFAAATVLTFLLWLLKLRDRYRAARRAAGLLDAPTAKFRAIRWLVQPRLTGRAWLIAVEYSLRDADLALARARLWRDTVTDHHDTHPGGRWWARRRAARRAAALAVRAAHLPAPDPAPVPAVALPDPAPTLAVASTASPPPVADPAPTVAAPVTDGATAVGELAEEPGEHTDGPAGAPDVPAAYTPTSDEDAAMYQAWRDALAAGREPTGADLARAAGRDNDSSGTGRRAARRYRDAHAAASQAALAATPSQPNGHHSPAGAHR